MAAFFEGLGPPRFTDGFAEGVGVDGVRLGRRVRGGERGELEPGVVALGEQRRGDGLGVALVDHAVDGVGGGEADLAVQLGDDVGEAFALAGELVHLDVGEASKSVGEDGVEGLGGEDVLLDGGEHERVELLHADGDAGASGARLLPGAAGVEVGPLLRLAAGGHADRAAAGGAAEERRQDAALARGDRVLAVAFALVAVARLQSADREHAGEVLVADGGLVDRARGDLSVVDEVAAVQRVREDRGDVLRPPRPRGVLPGHVGAAGGLDARAGEAVGEGAGAAHPFEGLAEEALHDLELGANVVGDDEAAIHDGVAVGRVAVLPVALFSLRLHPTDYVAGQLLAVALGEPRKDRPNQFPEGAVTRVGLRERDDVDVGLVQRRERAETVEHVPGDAAERPHVEAVDLVGAAPLGADAVALGLGALDEVQVGRATFGRAARDALVDEPVPRRDGHAVGLGAAEDLFTLLLDALVLAGVRAAEVGGADHGHGGFLGCERCTLHNGERLRRGLPFGGLEDGGLEIPEGDAGHPAGDRGAADHADGVADLGEPEAQALGGLADRREHEEQGRVLVADERAGALRKAVELDGEGAVRHGFGEGRLAAAGGPEADGRDRRGEGAVVGAAPHALGAVDVEPAGAVGVVVGDQAGAAGADVGAEGVEDLRREGGGRHGGLRGGCARERSDVR